MTFLKSQQKTASESNAQETTKSSQKNVGTFLQGKSKQDKQQKRFRGVCAICGEPCDYCDHEERDGFFIAGDNYPSVDHIVPLAKGGLHSWDNVQLAHFKCNTLKGARV